MREASPLGYGRASWEINLGCNYAFLRTNRADRRLSGAACCSGGRDRFPRNARQIRLDRVSGGLRGAAVRLDAVLAEQGAEAVELTVHPLVLRDDGLDVCPGCPLGLQPQLLGAQLLFPRAQRRGAVEVTCRERGRLLPLHLAELLGDVRKAGGDGQANEPCLRI